MNDRDRDERILQLAETVQAELPKVRPGLLRAALVDLVDGRPTDEHLPEVRTLALRVIELALLRERRDELLHAYVD